jgi:hypothetical protein
MSADTQTGDEQPSSSFLTGLEFLTGPDPNAGSFLLVVGIVTCMFIAVFQLALTPPVSNLLTGAVLVVAVISFILGAVLDMLGHFDSESTET